MSIQIDIPESLQISPFEIKMMLAVKLFEEGLITVGQGAKMVDLSKKAFIEVLGKYKVSIFQYDADDLEKEMSDAW
ncbi:MAG: UPF0175 family protein [Bacteroidota bacterium]